MNYREISAVGAIVAIALVHLVFVAIHRRNPNRGISTGCRIYGFFLFPMMFFGIGFFLVKEVAPIAMTHTALQGNSHFVRLDVLGRFWDRVLLAMSLAGVVSGGILGVFVDASFKELSEHRATGGSSPWRVRDELNYALLIATLIGAAAGLIATILVRQFVDLNAVWYVQTAWFHWLGVGVGAAAAPMATRIAF